MTLIYHANRAYLYCDPAEDRMPLVDKDDYDDIRLIAREQENAHIAANLRNTHLQERIRSLEAALREAHDAMVDISVQSSMSAVHRMASTSISKTYAALGIAPAETKSAPGFCPECLMTGGHKLRCSKAETTPKPITTFTGWIQGSCDNCGKSAREHIGISMGCPQAETTDYGCTGCRSTPCICATLETACDSRCAFDTNNGDRCILPDGHEGNHSL